MRYTRYIAEDLVTKILSRLPSKALARFTCVSKEWQRLTSSTNPATTTSKLLFFSYWEAKHLFLSESELEDNQSFISDIFQPENHQYFTSDSEPEGDQDFISDSEPEGDQDFITDSEPEDDQCFICHSFNNQIQVESVSFPIEEQLLKGHKVIAHCSSNGLVLIQIDWNFFLWNPLTGFFRKVLTYDILDEWGFYWIEGIILADLCFDCYSADYKVLLVQRTRVTTRRFYVATCGASNWEEIDFPRTVNNLYPGPFFKGYRHWLSKGAWSLECMEAKIFYFDPHTNEFIQVLMPQPKIGEVDTILGLGVLDRYLCMTRRKKSKKSDCNIEFLAMREYGNVNSWEIMFVISNIPEFRYGIVPLFKTNEGEVLVTNDLKRNLCHIKAYNADGESCKNISVSTHKDHISVILHDESWSSPRVDEWVIDNDIFGYYGDDPNNEEYSTYDDLVETEYSAVERILSRKRELVKKRKRGLTI